MNFSNTQKRAIEFNEGACLCLAGPGSGKTTVLTNRVKKLIDQDKVNPRDILVITFTKAAAMEMQNRFINLCGKRLPVTFGTFHAVYFSILKAAYNYTVDNIIKEDKKIQIIRAAIERSNLNPEDINELTNEIIGEISKVKTEGINIDVYYSANCPEGEFRKIYKYYVNQLQNARLIDFDDMLLYCYELLKARKDILAYWQKRYKYILIDEFQDINKIQYEVIKLLALPENNIFIVGDDDQSIYGFRGSKPEIMLNFDKDFPGTETIIMAENYRSSGNIVDAASLVIKNNKIRFDKKLRTDNERGDKVDILEFNTINEEYQRVVDTIKNFVNAGKKYSDFAVLFRTNSIAAPLVRKMLEYNIPFVLKDGIPNIYEHWISKDFMTYMVMALGSRKRSDFIQIMNKPLRYIGRDYVTDPEVNFTELEKYYEEKPWMIDRIVKFEEDLTMMSKMTPYAMINYLRKGIGYDDYIREYAEGHNLDKQELINIADEIMDSMRETKNCSDFFEYVKEYGESLKEGYLVKDYNNDAVTMTTMHSAKGLEYENVFIIDANEEITPHKKAVTDSEIEEERRMFYVAMTRAKNNLKILYSKERYNKKMLPSRFVEEIMEKM